MTTAAVMAESSHGASEPAPAATGESMIVDDAAHANPTMPPPLPVADLARIHHQAMDHARRIVELLRAELCGGASTDATTAAASSSSSATTASGKFLPSSATIEQALDAVAERVDLSARNSAAQLAAALAPSPPAKRGAATKAKSASAAATATASAAAAAPTSASPIASLLELQADLARSLPRTVALSSINTVRQWTAALYQREPALLELSAESNSKGLEAMLGRSAVATERHRDEEYQAMVVAELSGKAWPAMSLKKNVAVGSAAASAVVAAPATTAKHGGDMTTQPKDKDDNTPPTDDQASATSAQEDTADDARSSRRPMRQAAIKAMQTTEEMSTTASTLPDAMHRIDVAEVERNKTPGQGLMAPRYALIMKAGDRHVFSSLRATKAVGPVPLPPDVNLMAVQPTLCPTVVHEQLGATEALYKRPRLAVTPHDPSVRLPPTAPTLGDICPAPPRPNPQQEQHERLRKRKQRPVTLVEYLDTAVTGRSFAPQYDSSNASVSNEVAVLAYAGLDARRRQKRGLMGALAKRMEAVVEVLKGMVGGGSEGASASVVKVDGVDTPAATVPPSLAASTENLSKEMRASAESVSSSTASLPEVGDGHVVPTAMDVDNTSADQGKVAENVLLGPAEVAAALLEAGVDLDDMSAPLKPRFTSLKDEDHVAAVIEETSVLLAHLHQLQSDRLASVTLSDRSFTTITTDGLLTANARKAMDRLLAPLDVERAAYQRVELNLARLVASVPPQDLVSLEALDGLRHMAAWLGVKDVSYNGTLALRPPIRPVDADTLARQLPHHLGATSGGQRPIFPQTVTAGATAAVTAHMTPVSMPPQVQAQLQAHMVNMTPAQRQAFLHNYGQNMAQNMQRVTGASGSVGPTAAAISAQVAAMLRTPAVVQQQQQQQQQPLSQRVTAITAASATPATARASPTNNANYQCANCGKRESPTWRQGEFPDMKLCNACGLYWGKHHRARPLKETFW